MYKIKIAIKKLFNPFFNYKYSYMLFNDATCTKTKTKHIKNALLKGFNQSIENRDIVNFHISEFPQFLDLYKEIAPSHKVKHISFQSTSEINSITQLSLNNFYHLCKKERLKSYKGEFVDPSEESEKLILFIPFHFQLDIPDNPVFQSTREFYCKLIIELIKITDFVPIFQFGFSPIFEFSNTKTISYHTKRIKNCLHIKESTIPNHFTIDQSGYAGWHSITNYNPTHEVSSTQWNELLNEKLHKFKSHRLSKYNQPTEKAVLNNKKYLFFPLQVIDDSVAQLAYISTLNLLKFLIKNINFFPYTLIIKRHPMCNSIEIKNLLSTLNNKKIIIFNGNIHDAILRSEKIITVNSGVGLEALCYEKHVITTGKSHYQVATTLCRNENELLKAINSPPSDKHQNINKSFLIEFFKNHLYTKETTQKISNKLNSFINED